MFSTPVPDGNGNCPADRACCSARLHVFSAGSTTAAAPNPLAVETLAQQHVSSESPQSKGWEEFAAEGPPVMARVFPFAGNDLHHHFGRQALTTEMNAYQQERSCE